MIKTILVPVDGSAHAQRAVEFGTDLALKYRARIEFAHVGIEHQLPAVLLKLAEAENIGTTSQEVHAFVWQRLVDDAEQYAKGKGMESVSGSVLSGDPASAIVARAKEIGADMIVMGSRGMGEIKGLLLGSVSHKVVSLAPCTCVTVR
jgi:nucleotide-binding universal stress UspA family protein